MSAPTVDVAGAAAAVRRTPYQGLVPYTEADADWFFGRDEWSEVVGDNLRAYRITVLYGTSGVGKSSVLRAGPLRRLTDEARRNAADFGAPRLLPLGFSAWSLDDPVTALKQAVAAAVRGVAPELAGEPPDGPLADVLEAWPERIEGPLLLVLDQFEEFFLYHDRPRDSALDEVASALRRRNPAVHFLLSIREDSLAKLDRFKGHVPGLLDHLLRIDHLDRDAAAEAIVEPLKLWSERLGEEVMAENDLVEAILDQVTAGQVSLASGATGKSAPRQGGTEGIVAPYLQLVLERLWDEEHSRWAQDAGEPRVLRLQALDDLGGAERIVSTHLDAALAALPPEDQDVAGKVFRHLVTPSGSKIALRISDLAKLADLPEERIDPLVTQLTGDVRILRGAGEGRYEIYHDALSGPILDWSARWQERHRRRRERRRLMLLGGIAVVLAGIAALITVFAIQANHAKQKAEASGLGLRATNALPTDPALALSEALQAMHVDRHAEPPPVLQQAALASHLIAVLRADASPVVGARFTPDSTQLVTVRASGSGEVWDTKTADRVAVLSGSGRLRSLAFSRDGRLVALQRVGSKVTIWESATGRSLRSLGAPTDIARLISFDPGGARVAVVSRLASGARVVIWSVDSGRMLTSQTIRHLPTSVAFSPDGKHLIATFVNGSVTVIDPREGSRVSAVPAVSDYYQFLVPGVYSPDGTYFATAGSDGSARLYKARTGHLYRTYAHGSALTSVAFAPDGRLVLGGADGRSEILNPKARQPSPPIRLLGHGDAITSIAFSGDGNWIVTSSTDGTARVWSARTGSAQATLLGHRDTVSTAIFSPDGEQIVTTSEDGTARLWRTPAQRPAVVLPPHLAEVGHASFSRDGRLVLTTSADGSAVVASAETGLAVRTFGEPRRLSAASLSFARRVWGDRPNATRLIFEPRAALSADGTRILTGSDVSGGATLWNVQTGKRIRNVLPRTRYYPNVAFFGLGPAGAWGGVSASRPSLWLFDSHTGVSKGVLRGDLDHVAPFAGGATTDGTYVAAASFGGGAQHSAVMVWNVRTRKLVHRLAVRSRGHAIRNVAIDPLGKRVAGSTWGGTLLIWSVRSGKLLHALQMPTAIGDISFSPDGTLLAVAGDANSAKIWDVRTWKKVAELRGHTAGINAIKFSRDGRLVVTASDDGTVRVWTTQSGEMRAEFWDGRAGRALDASFDRSGRRIVVAGSDGSSEIYVCGGLCGGKEDLLRYAEEHAPLQR